MRFSSGLMAWAAMSVTALGVAQEGNMMRPTTAPVLNRFARIEAMDFKTLLPFPPAEDSIAAQADLEVVRQAQAWRNEEQVAWAKRVETDQVFNHANQLGAWFNAERLPVAAAFFKHVSDDMRAIDSLAKKPFLRPRPSTVDASIHPCVKIPASTSYPSGSAMQAFVWAEMLAEILPAKRDELIERAHRAAWGRVIGGVHFPSDLVAGRLLARTYLEQCRANPVFREAFKAVREEVTKAAQEK